MYAKANPRNSGPSHTIPIHAKASAYARTVRSDVRSPLAYASAHSVCAESVAISHPAPADPR